MKTKRLCDEVLRQHRQLAKEIHGPEPGEAAAEVQQTKWSAYHVHGNGASRLLAFAGIFLGAVATFGGCALPFFTATYHVPVFHDGIDPVTGRGWRETGRDGVRLHVRARKF